MEKAGISLVCLMKGERISVVCEYDHGFVIRVVWWCVCACYKGMERASAGWKWRRVWGLCVCFEEVSIWEFKCVCVCVCVWFRRETRV